MDFEEKKHVSSSFTISQIYVSKKKIDYTLKRWIQSARQLIQIVFICMYLCIHLLYEYVFTCSGESAYIYIRRNLNPILVVWARSQATKDIRSQERLRGEAKNDIDHLGRREGIAAQDGVRERVRSEQAEEHQGAQKRKVHKDGNIRILRRGRVEEVAEHHLQR